MEASFLGSGQPKSKSINVEADILSEWAVQRQKSVRRGQLVLLGITSSIVALLLFVPQMNSLSETFRLEVNVKEQELKGLNAVMASLQGNFDRAKPEMERARLLKERREFLNAAIGQIRQVSNSTQGSIVFNTLSFSVTGGQFAFQGRGFADGDESLKRFMEELAKGSGSPKASLLVQRPQTTLGPNGREFDFVRKSSVH